MSSLLEILKKLKEDPTVVIELYKQLFESEYFTLVRKGTEDSLGATEFLTHDTIDEIKELPLFTSKEFIIESIISEDSTILAMSGMQLWNRLLDVINTGKTVVAINPGQQHGIRLTKEMILGMISIYGAK